MILIILIAFFSLIGLIVLHEFGHFILAKRFGVKVEEFGVGLPPRIFGKKIGETIYSLNLLPFGAFVKIYGEEGGIEDYRSFSKKPMWQRASIILGGVVVFWIVAFILLSIVMGLGVPTAVEDEANHNLIDPKVQIIQVSANSPAEKAGLKIGDTIKQLTVNPEKKSEISNGAGNQQSLVSAQDGELVEPLTITKVKEVQDFTAFNLGEEITLTIQRGKETFETKLVPRVSPPEGEGAMGVSLVRTAIVSYPWHQAPFQGILATANLTITIIQSWGLILKNIIIGEGLPPGAQIMGPVGIFGLFTQMAQLGINYFLRFIAVISIYLAIFNILPIPALDGGKLLFLGIEAVRRKPIPQKVEQRITAVFFALLIIIMVWVTIKDVARLF